MDCTSCSPSHNCAAALANAAQLAAPGSAVPLLGKQVLAVPVLLSSTCLREYVPTVPAPFAGAPRTEGPEGPPAHGGATAPLEQPQDLREVDGPLFHVSGPFCTRFRKVIVILIIQSDRVFVAGIISGRSSSV